MENSHKEEQQNFGEESKWWENLGFFPKRINMHVYRCVGSHFMYVKKKDKSISKSIRITLNIYIQINAFSVYS